MTSVVNFIVYGLITMARIGYNSIVLLPSYETIDLNFTIEMIVLLLLLFKTISLYSLLTT